MLACVRHRRLCGAMVFLLVLGVAAGLAVYRWLLADLPSLDSLHDYAAAPSSKVYDRHGRLLFEMPPPHGGFHSPVALDEIPLQENEHKDRRQRRLESSLFNTRETLTTDAQSSESILPSDRADRPPTRETASRRQRAPFPGPAA